MMSYVNALFVKMFLSVRRKLEELERNSERSKAENERLHEEVC